MYTDLSSVMQRLYALFTASPSPAGGGHGSHATVHLSTTSSAPTPPPDGARYTSTTSGSAGDGSGISSAAAGGDGAWSGRWNHLSRLRNAGGVAGAASGRGARTARMACSALRWNCGTISSTPARPPPPAESDRAAIPEPETNRSATPQQSNSPPRSSAAWLGLAAVIPHKSASPVVLVGANRLEKTDLHTTGIWFAREFGWGAVARRISSCREELGISSWFLIVTIGSMMVWRAETYALTPRCNAAVLQ